MEQTLNYKLEGFEGPLDLLLQLIARNKYNIYDIPLLELIDQYLAQIEEIKEEEKESTILLEEQELFENNDDLPTPEEADNDRDFTENY